MKTSLGFITSIILVGCHPVSPQGDSSTNPHEPQALTDQVGPAMRVVASTCQGNHKTFAVRTSSGATETISIALNCHDYIQSNENAGDFASSCLEDGTLEITYRPNNGAHVGHGAVHVGTKRDCLKVKGDISSALAAAYEEDYCTAYPDAC
jgi:hypothetical protein